MINPARTTRFLFVYAALALLGAICGPAHADTMPATPAAAPSADGVLRLKSTHSVADTVARIKKSVEDKKIHYIDAIDQNALATEAKLTIGKSTLVLFGNPPLGVQFLQGNRYAGLDWPVRMLVVEEADGSVWIAWTDFRWIAKRYDLKNLDAQLKMATEVAGTIATEAAN